jgi:hypothetical protein
MSPYINNSKSYSSYGHSGSQCDKCGSSNSYSSSSNSSKKKNMSPKEKTTGEAVQGWLRAHPCLTSLQRG